MRSNVIKGIVVGAVAVMMITSVTACGMSNEVKSNMVVEAAWEESSDAEQMQKADDTMMDYEDEIEAVQNTLTYMGGLKTSDDADKAIDVAIFRNEDGDVIYIYEVDGNLDYGMYTTESATTADGKDYAKIEGSIGSFGYYFNEDCVSGIIVDTEGNVYDAVELDEEGARDYVKKTL